MNSKGFPTGRSPPSRKSPSARSCRGWPARAASCKLKSSHSPPRSPPMDCNETRRLIEADVDDELDLVRHLELEAHLKGCAECTRLSENLRARRLALRESLPRFTASPQFTGKVLAALRAEGASGTAPARAPRIAP